MKIAIVGLAIGGVAAPAIACSPPPPVMILPGESKQAFNERQQSNLIARSDEEQRAYQIDLEEQAKTSFIGVVTGLRYIQLGSDIVGREVTVRPMRAVKGLLPPKPVALRDATSTTCGLSGGGSATSGIVGEYVIVFEGLEDRFYSGGTGKLGVLAKEARAPELLRALRSFEWQSLEPNRHPAG